ncbi:MAG: hypothetical protein K2Q22_04370, partial [Cytophagales bacterium]|nr:hypothetical protein [Cytophagales bacterium]
NYRVSYFLNKPGPPAWNATYNVCEGVPSLTCTTNPTFATQSLVPGLGYNHRFILTFPPQLATITPFLFFYANQGRFIHEGALYPQRLVMQVNGPGFTPYDWTTDWSYDPAVNGAADGHPYYPVTNDWTDPLNLNVPVTKYQRNSCTNDAPTLATKVLVEEWDGYTWRRIYGSSPVSGTALANVTTTSQIPVEVTYGGTVPGFSGPSNVSGNILTWPVIPSMLTNESYTFKYWVTVKNNAYFGCGTTPSPTFFVATASGAAINQSKVNATTTVGVTCMPIVVVPPLTTMTKTANATSHSVGTPITYTINYQQTHGQVVSGNLNSADWNNVIGGNPVSIASNALNLNTGWSNQAWVHRYSHGTNGSIQGTLNFNANSPYQIIARQNGANRLEISFNVNPGAGNFALVVSTIVGGTATPLCTASPSPSFVGITTATSFDFRVTLTNSTVSIWVVKSGTAISGAATFVCTNVPINAGYAGIRSAIGNPASLTNWYTNLDSGFNLILLDPVPSPVTFGSATNANLSSCPSCTGAPITGTIASGVVTYKAIPGPVLYGESITYSWTGTVTSCPSGAQIV